LTLEIQPLIKRESIWKDHKTLFPVLEMGFCIWDIHVKPAKGTDYRLWKAIFTNRNHKNSI
jgi:hypothetical protein